jgi:methylglutaconyl-CoA hydratase
MMPNCQTGCHPLKTTPAQQAFSAAHHPPAARHNCEIATMAPRTALVLNAAGALRSGRLAIRRSARFYSAESAGPLLRITDLPAPNSGHIRVLELNRPSARNAISRVLLNTLRDEIDAVHTQYDAATGEEIPSPEWEQPFGGVPGEPKRGPTRALIIASAVDTAFCAGADLKERKGFTQEE